MKPLFLTTDNDGIFWITGSFLHFCYCGFGVFIVYLGYKLFIVNIKSGEINIKSSESETDKEGKIEKNDLTTSKTEFKGQYGKLKLELKNAAPGTYFALFGSFVICASIFKGIEEKRKPEDSIPNQIGFHVDSNFIKTYPEDTSFSPIDDTVSSDLKK